MQKVEIESADTENSDNISKKDLLIAHGTDPYWKDPHGFTLEHFTDGDLFNVSFGSHKQPIETLMGVHWGPEGTP